MTEPGTLLTFQDLDIEGPSEGLMPLAEQLEKVLPGKIWQRDPKKEEAMQSASDHSLRAVVFNRTADDILPAASLSLVVSGGGARVGNIVPVKTGQLTMEQYNAILNDFVTVGIKPIAQALRLKPRLTSAYRQITDWLSAAAVKKLLQFSRAANKATGSAHPSDYKRWLAFILQTHQDRAELSAELLVRWLVEVERWPEETAHTLGSEYTFGLDLLEQRSNVD